MSPLLHPLQDIHGEFLKQFWKLLENESVVYITTHVNADMDAIASTFGMKFLLQSLFPDKQFHLVIPGQNALATHVLESLNLLGEIERNWPLEIPFLLVVDTNDLLVTELPREKGSNIITLNLHTIVMIDHHLEVKTPDSRLSLTHTLSNYESNAEIIAELFQCVNITPSIVIAKLMAIGILTDTGYFKYGNNRSIAIMNWLLNIGIDLKEINHLLSVPLPNSERIARLKAAIRMGEIRYVGEYMVAISHVSSYEASASKALVDLGADIGFVIVREKAKRFRMSARAAESLYAEHKLHLGDFLSKFGPIFGGSGGGHDGAAGCYGFIKTEEYLNEIIPVLLKELKTYFEQQEYLKST